MVDDSRATKLLLTPRASAGRTTRTWALKVGTSILVWMVIMHLTSVWQPCLPKPWPTPCFHVRGHPNATNAVLDLGRSPPSLPTIVPRRVYKSNGYLLVSCNGGLNQMRAAICDMVTVARYLNLTLVVPELDKTSFWADSSDFSDVFNVKHFINSLRDEVKIIRKLPEKFHRKILDKSGRKIHRQIFSMTPISWSSEKSYLKQMLVLQTMAFLLSSKSFVAVLIMRH